MKLRRSDYTQWEGTQAYLDRDDSLLLRFACPEQGGPGEGVGPFPVLTKANPGESTMAIADRNPERENRTISEAAYQALEAEMERRMSAIVSDRLLLAMARARGAAATQDDQDRLVTLMRLAPLFKVELA